MSYYIAIDLKSFYASVECVDRGFDPLKAKLVVADPTRTEKTICLAVSPALKNLGIPGRARLFEVLARTRDFVIAPPRMRRYMEVSAEVFKIYTKYVSTDDIHVYSIDEAFLDVTEYLKMHQKTPRELAITIVQDVLKQTGITATAGIGTNLYLAKIAMDIEAKHLPADRDGVRVAELNEISYRRKLWTHQPLTDFWRVGPGYARKLNALNINTMGDLARFSLTGSDKLYQIFGVNAELLIDHAWGFEPVTMRDIKKYRAKGHSISVGQVLAEPYDYRKARIIVWEMADSLSLDLVKKKILTDKITLSVGYDKNNTDYGNDAKIDRYGRKVPKSMHASINLGKYTSSGKMIAKKALELFDSEINPSLLVRRFCLVAERIKTEQEATKTLRQLDLFTDYKTEQEKTEREKRLQKAEILIKEKFGKNSILKLKNLEDGATMRDRNNQIGGHKA